MVKEDRRTYVRTSSASQIQNPNPPDDYKVKKNERDQSAPIIINI